MRRYFALTLLIAALPSLSRGDDPDSPRPTPITRPEMKKYIEDMKGRKPRIPLPELTAEEKEKLGERGSGYEGRVRSLYAPGTGNASGGPRPAEGTRPPEGTRPSGGRENEPGMTLDYKFKTELFWIVSRTNNCQYCLGHQEGKLLGAGMLEDEIACLDGDWSEFTLAEQAAFRLTRRLTLEPHLLTDADIEQTRKHFTDLQILEMVLSVAGNNSTNRWKEGVGVPQSAGGGNFGRRPAAEGTTETRPEAHTYLTPTSEKYSSKATLVAPIVKDKVDSRLISATVAKRPPLESHDEVEKALAIAATRKARLPLVDEAKAREALGEDAPEGALPAWIRLVANFPQSGKRLVTTIRNANEKGDLSPLLKAQASWIIARQDRAWYATAEAKQRLEKLGQSDDQIYALDGKWDGFTPREQALFTVAKNLAASPVVLTDAQVAKALELAGPRDTVQMITYTNSRASFNRFTEAAGLAIEK